MMVDYETNSDGEFIFPTFTQFISEIIYYDVKNVSSATLTVNDSGNGKGYGLFLSNDDGLTWENCSNGIAHIFITIGQKLRYRIVGEIGCRIYAPVRVDYITA